MIYLDKNTVTLEKHGESIGYIQNHQVTFYSDYRYLLHQTFTIDKELLEILQNDEKNNWEY